MKLLSCHIENYGKISQKDFTFDEMSTFVWDNGSGKTTLVSFIKAMLYGLSSTKMNAKIFDDRQHFYPFNYGKFGGSLTLKAGVEEYRIERFFDKKSASSDVVKIYKNGAIQDDFSSDVGRKILGMDEDTFMKTVFFDATDTEICTPAGIEARMNNYEDGAKAKKVLDEQIKKLKPERGKNGKIYECQEQVRRLREETSYLKEKGEELAALYNDKSKKQDELALNEKGLKEGIYNAGRQHEFNALNDMFLVGVPTAEDFERIESYIKSVEEYEENNKRIKNEFDGAVKKGKRTKLLLTVNAFMLITAAVLLMVKQFIPAIITLVAAGVLAVYLCINAKKIKTVAELSEQMRKNNLRIDFFTQEIFEFVNQYTIVRDDTDFAKEIDKIKTAAENYIKIKEKKSESDFSLLKLESRNKEIKAEISALERQIIRIETEIESLDEKLFELNDNEKSLAEYQNQLFILEAARDALVKSEENLKNKYNDPIKANFDKYADVIKEATGAKIILDDKYNVYFEAMGEQQSYKHFSQGERSMLAFCFKMALLDSLYEERKPFVLLDDPFISLDSENMSKMAKIIKEISKDRQIIYFCCHESRNVL